MPGKVGHKPECPCFICKRGRGEFVPLPPPRKYYEGYPTHKPHCDCSACNAYRGKAKAVARATGEAERRLLESQTPAQILRPDLPILEAAKGSRNRQHVAAWLEMKALEPNLSKQEGSKRLGLAPQALSSMLSKAAKEGWLKFDDPLEVLEHEVIPQTISNLKTLLSSKEINEKVTIEVAKGVIFPMYRESKGISDAPKFLLALTIEPSPNDMAVSGVVVGRGKTVVDATEVPEDET